MTQSRLGLAGVAVTPAAPRGTLSDRGTSDSFDLAVPQCGLQCHAVELLGSQS